VRPTLALLIAAGAALAGYVAWRATTTDAREAVSVARAPVTAPAQDQTAARAAAEGRAALEPEATPPASAQGARSPARGGAAAERQRADQIRDTLRRARAGRAAPPPSQSSPARGASAQEAPAAHMPALEGEGNQAERPLGRYVQTTIRQQFIPLAVSCYEQLLERMPQARGKVVLELTIVGDSDVGGVVDDVQLGEGTTLEDEELSTCVSESLYSTVFDAPPEGEDSVTVSYPIELEP
jgi:hypothetical protein